MKAFKDVKVGDILFKLCFADYSVETLTVHTVSKQMFDNSTMIGYNNGACGFRLEAYEEDLGKCWLFDTLSYAICTDYEAVGVAIKENSASGSKPNRRRRP